MCILKLAYMVNKKYPVQDMKTHNGNICYSLILPQMGTI